MPRIKRYGPIAHGFNRDAEVRTLRQEYADWMGYVWLEMCLIADLNGGEVKGTPSQIGESLAYISLSKRPSLSAKCITNALGFMEKCGWIEILLDRVLIINYLKYHPFENSITVPTNELTIRTNEHKKNKRIHIAPTQNFPDEWKWLEEWVKRQNDGFPIDQFLNWAWWDSVSETCGGISESWLDTESAKWKTWIMNNPTRAPTPKGFRRFVSGWLQRSYEKERIQPNGERTRQSNFIRK